MCPIHIYQLRNSIANLYTKAQNEEIHDSYYRTVGK